MASAAAVAVASAAAVVPLAGADVEVVVGATIAIRTTSDLTHFRLRNMNFFEVLLFRNSLEIIFRNFNNSFLTSIISLQAKFGI